MAALAAPENVPRGLSAAWRHVARLVSDGGDLRALRPSLIEALDAAVGIDTACLGTFDPPTLLPIEVGGSRVGGWPSRRRIWEAELGETDGYALLRRSGLARPVKHLSAVTGVGSSAARAIATCWRRWG